MNQSIFKANDIRGIYPSEINESSAAAVGEACAKLFKPGEILIAHDARHGSPELSKAVAEGLNKASGGKHKINFVGLSTTPMFYFLVNELKASGGCMITASHNPKNYNGIKVVGEKAAMISGLTIKNMISMQ